MPRESLRERAYPVNPEFPPSEEVLKLKALYFIRECKPTQYRQAKKDGDLDEWVTLKARAARRQAENLIERTNVPLDPSSIWQLFMSKGVPYSYYDLPEFEVMWKAQASELDPTKRAEKIRVIQRWLYEEMWRIPVVMQHTSYGIGPKVESWKLVPGTTTAYASQLNRVRLK